MAFQEQLKNTESNNGIDRASEMMKLQNRLVKYMPEHSESITEKLNKLDQLSRESFAKAVGQIEGQLSLLEGKQAYVDRDSSRKQMSVLIGEKEASMPDFKMA